MRNKRKFAKSKNKIIQIIENHVSKNIKEYAISILVFFIGIIIGVMILNSSNAENQKDISGYINEFIQTIKNNEYQIDTKKLLINSIMSNLKLAIIIWISGSTIIGIPLVYGCLGYKGICIGYSISAIIAVLEKGKGIIFAISSMLLQNIIAIPCILALTVSSIKMYKSTMKEYMKKNKEIIKFEKYRHTMFSLFMAIGLIISSVIEVFVTTNITNNIIINFI